MSVNAPTGAFLDSHVGLNLLSGDCSTVDQALAERHQLSFYDAHIVASATLANVQTLYSEDMHNGLQIRGLTLKNPFAAH